MNHPQTMHYSPAGLTRGLIVGALLLFVNVGSQAGVIAVSSNLQVKATAGRSVTEVIDIDSDSQGATINDLGTVSAKATSGTLNTSGSAHASWVSAAEGSVTFMDMGWSNGPSDTSFSSLAGTEWRYTFIADIDGVFSLDFDIQHDPDNTCLCGDPNFGLQTFRFSLVGPGTGFLDVLRVGTPGTATRFIRAGGEYTALITTPDGIFGGVGNRDSHMNATFNWSMDSGPINNVPAPLSALVLLTGLMLTRLLPLNRKTGTS